MQVYDKVIEKTRELLKPFPAKELNRNHAKSWNLLKENEFLLQKEVAFELGIRSQPSTCYQAVTSSKELISEDQILLYGPDLPEIKKNVPFTRITWIQIDPIEDQDKAYQRIKKLEFAKFKIIPEGYMMLSSSMDQKEQVRVSKKAMKKALANTRVSVKLRKSEYREEWYLYVEAYPVFQADKPTPQRVREYLNRTITTPIWDKSRNARTDKDGKTTYKPKRDLNGIIQCKSQLDQESCIYADKVRSLRQKEYDNASLYSETDAEQAEQLERSRYNFIEYFDHVQRTRHAHSSDSIIANWNRVYELLKIFSKGNTIPFLQIDLKFVESFRQFILNAPQGGTKNGTLSQNTASTYFSIFKAALKQAFIDGYLTVDISAKVKGIQGKESRREYLTVEELNRLAQTPCDPLLKRASLFSALTGLRHCDIQKLKWSEVEEFNGGYRLNFTQQKTKGVEYMPISEQAYQLCGERKDGEKLVFAGLPDPSWINRPIKKWVAEAGITKHITYHCFRHSYATLQLAGGTDIYTVSKMLGHTNVRTTQIYAKVVDAKKEEATKTIKLDLPMTE